MTNKKFALTMGSFLIALLAFGWYMGTPNREYKKQCKEAGGTPVQNEKAKVRCIDFDGVPALTPDRDF